MNGVWHWVDPVVAEAIAAEEAAFARLTELQARFAENEAQIDVWALDPDYDAAMDGAGVTLDETLAPHGYCWVRPEPEGDLADAQARLEEAGARLEEARGAVAAYEEYERLLGEAITMQENMPFYPDGVTPVASSPDSDFNYEEEFEKGEAARAEVAALRYQAEAQRALGDKLLGDYNVGLLESSFEDSLAEGGAEAPDLAEGEEPVEITIGEETVLVTPQMAQTYEEEGLEGLFAGGQPIGIRLEEDGEWQWVETQTGGTWLELQQARTRLEALEGQLEIAEAYAQFYDARSDLAALGPAASDIEQRLLAAYNEQNPHLLEEGRKHSTLGNDYLGELLSQDIVEEGGELWVVNEFEEKTQKIQLTFPEDELWDAYRYTDLNAEWQELVAGQLDADAAMCTSDGLGGLKAAELRAGETVNRVLGERLGVSIEDLEGQLDELDQEYRDLLGEHGPGSLDAGVLPDGVQPDEITVGGETVKVSPEVAAAYEEDGIAALAGSGTPIGIEFDHDGDGAAEWRWVDPELAVSWLAMRAAEVQIETLRETQGSVTAAADWYAFQRTQPLKLLDDAATPQHLARLQDAYLEAHEEEMLDGRIQPRMQALYEQGHDGSFQPVSDGDIAEALNLDADSEEGAAALDKVREEITDIGGADAEVAIVPIFYVDATVGLQQTALFAVRNGEGETRYVDMAGKAFDGVEDFQDHNTQFSEDGRLIVPEELRMSPDADGRFALDVVQARNVSAWERIVDPVVGIATTAASVAAFVPVLTPVAAPLAVAGTAYLGTRTVINQVNHLRHGGEWSERESLMNTAMFLTTALPVAGGGLRTIGMARNLNITKGQAFLAGMGATRAGPTVQAADDAGRFSRIWHRFPHAAPVGAYIQTAGGLNRVAHGLDGTAIAIGAPVMAVSAYDLAAHGDQMSGLQITDAITGLATGFAGTA
ncbi:hypothetical protein, partial [Aquamicrobium sp. LC103]|uniref:hypothetical protein n=1 Tax=Aquamicrobium sp. LC103 TaxID=1120658 RepID=UPI00197EBC85